jgi:hypothetical protein
MPSAILFQNPVAKRVQEPEPPRSPRVLALPMWRDVFDGRRRRMSQGALAADGTRLRRKPRLAPWPQTTGRGSAPSDHDSPDGDQPPKPEVPDTSTIPHVSRRPRDGKGRTRMRSGIVIPTGEASPALHTRGGCLCDGRLDITRAWRAAGRRVGWAGVTIALPAGWHAMQLAVPPGVPYSFPGTAVALVVLEWTRQLDLPHPRRRNQDLSTGDLPVRLDHRTAATPSVLMRKRCRGV